MEIKTYKVVLKEDVTIDCPSVQIMASDDAEKIFRQAMEGATEEYCWMVTLNVKGNITGLFEVSHGGLAEASIHPRDIFKRAIVSNAAAIIIAHNHPSGDTSPSDEDIIATNRIKQAGEIIGIKLLDHIIIGNENGDYTSLKASGVLI